MDNSVCAKKRSAITGAQLRLSAPPGNAQARKRAVVGVIRKLAVPIGTRRSWTDIYRFDISTGLIDELRIVTGDETRAPKQSPLADPAPAAKLFWPIRTETPLG